MNAPRITRKHLLETFHSYGNPPDKWLIGGEYERCIVHPDGTPVSYHEPYGIGWFLQQFEQRWGFDSKVENGNIIALWKDGRSITLEPGGQFELSGAPHKDLQDLVAEFQLNRQHLLELCQEAKLTTITCGLTPVASIENIGWMPKGRYELMRNFLPQYGDLALYMMKGTASVQCNYDYADEADCRRKVRLCASMAPITTAMFANSPLYRNQPTNFMSYRGHIWTRTDPNRTGLPAVLSENFSFEQWLDYLLDVPMMFIYHKGWISAHGRSFRQFMEQGIDGHFPSEQDWDLHMTSVFPEVRIKRTIEVRGADCVNHDLAISFCALFTGLLYDQQARDSALELLAHFTQQLDREQRFDIACRHGLAGEIGGHRLSWWAEQLTDYARQGLSRWQPQNTHLLDPLIAQINTGHSPAMQLLEAWKKDASAESIIRAVAY